MDFRSHIVWETPHHVLGAFSDGRVVMSDARMIAAESDPVATEEIWKHMHHRLAVLEHVGYAGRYSQIVLEDVNGAVAIAHQV